MLVWSPPASEGGGVRLLPMDRYGTSAGHERAVMPGRLPNVPSVDAFVVRAVRQEERVAVAWVERQVGRFPVMTTVGAPTDGRFPPPKTLAVLNLVRGVDPADTVAIRRGPTFGGSAGVWVFPSGRCAAGAEDCPATQTFALEALFPVAGESPPDSASTLPQDPGPTGRFSTDLPRWTKDHAEQRAVCEHGKLQLRFEWREQLRLQGMDEAVDRLEGWLPEELAPAGSRALWTGEALLVVIPSGGELALKRYECIHDRLTRTDLLSLRTPTVQRSDHA